MFPYKLAQYPLDRVQSAFQHERNIPLMLPDCLNSFARQTFGKVCWIMSFPRVFNKKHYTA